MCRITKSPTYLFRNSYSYCFRMRVPQDLQGVIGKKELRYSLRTGYLGSARTKSGVLAGNMKTFFWILRDKKSDMANRTQIFRNVFFWDV